MLASLLLGVTVRTRYTRHVLGIAWVGIAFTFAVAPVPRYGLGYFLLPVAALVAAALEHGLAAPRLAEGFSGWVKTSAYPSGAAALAGAAVLGVLIFASTARGRASLL